MFIHSSIIFFLGHKSYLFFFFSQNSQRRANNLLRQSLALDKASLSNEGKMSLVIIFFSASSSNYIGHTWLHLLSLHSPGFLIHSILTRILTSLGCLFLWTWPNHLVSLSVFPALLLLNPQPSLLMLVRAILVSRACNDYIFYNFFLCVILFVWFPVH